MRGPVEAISVARAMHANTIDAACILSVEDRIGGLERGKFADSTILEDDPFTVNPRELKDIPVWGTVLGRKVHKSK